MRGTPYRIRAGAGGTRPIPLMGAHVGQNEAPVPREASVPARIFRLTQRPDGRRKSPKEPNPFPPALVRLRRSPGLSGIRHDGPATLRLANLVLTSTAA